MLTIVVVSLSVALLVVLAVGLVAFSDVAFRAPRQALLSGEKWNWQPPVLQGRELLNWVATTARSATVDFLSGRRTATTATELASELHGGATTAINLGTTPDRHADSPVSCHTRIAVTPPEVLGIVDYVRKNRPLDELRQIQDRAAENCLRFETMDRQQDMRCPLLNGQDTCCAFPARPIRCRGFCPAARASDETSTSSTLDQNPQESRGHVVVQGAESGFRSGLNASGLDGNLYELNAALVAALDAPDAAQRWANGDSVFHTCNTYE